MKRKIYLLLHLGNYKEAHLITKQLRNFEVEVDKINEDLELFELRASTAQEKRAADRLLMKKNYVAA